MRTHGLASTYNGGCRCEPCTEANRIRQRQIRSDLSKKPFDQIPHGTPNAYSNYCCKCPECKEIGRIKNAESRVRRHERFMNGEVHPAHGRASTYDNYGCRCPACKEAATNKNRQNRRNRKDGVWATSQPIQT